MQANQIHRVALSDASGRANLSPARPVGKKPTNGPAMPSFNEFMAMTNAKQAAAKTVGPPAPSTVAAPKFTLPTAPKATTASGGSKKRKSETTLQEDIAAYKQNLNNIVSPVAFEDEALPSCKAVRTRINKLLDSNIMNKTEFSNAIGVSTRSLSTFLQASGQMGGSGSSAYPNAWAWFRQREVAKIKMPDVKKRQKLEADAAAESNTSANAGAGGKPSSAAPAKTKTVDSLPDISGIHLAGEETDNVPVYDTCDEIRRKINLHLKTPGLTQAQFCRDIHAQLKVPKCKSIQSKQLADFRAMKGPRAGAKSSVFYASYVYFEKLRIAQNKPKTAHRETMERLWAGNGGFDRESDHRTYYTLAHNETLTIDQWGVERIE
ncbi:hypothetical protein GGR51DRAFT_518791 [Nemania sp. FL0031]|nr:hypothetical protein GGR51DRAFT_518791 [Nemania sp. FL0031]